ncbi:hypothetical protein ATL39_0463 [Sinobaca qinghaiensis]|uniref:Uncharacterized protein n=1 Tax=Sinobaca qinghaiensis TaxID=342944 RepID=A0A419V8G1_9BACL|nr:hypothetical protein [Sinobaca qinghaiensis]RKD76248.1 hypothetical protein ATL39_0463 [Sinobaca qinghaiensis]
MPDKKMLVGKISFDIIGRWSLWFLAIYLVIYFGTGAFMTWWGDDIMTWSFLENSRGSARIYFFIAGILSMGGLIRYYVSNGVTRRDYFFGTMGAAVILAALLTVVFGAAYGLETMAAAFTGWTQSQSGSTLNLPGQLLSSFFQFILYYAIGWFISASFFRFHWFVGLLLTFVGGGLMGVIELFWEAENSIFQFISVMASGGVSLMVSVLLSTLLFLLLAAVIRMLTKRADIKAV